jgi:hypothetical protein
MYIFLKYIINVCRFLRNFSQFWVFIAIFTLSASKLVRNSYYYLRSIRSVKICCPVLSMTNRNMHNLYCAFTDTLSPCTSKRTQHLHKNALQYPISRILSSGIWCYILNQLGINILEEPTNFSFWWKMKAAHSSEMPVPTYHVQSNHIPQTHNLNTHHHENPKSHFNIQLLNTTNYILHALFFVDNLQCE